VVQVEIERHHDDAGLDVHRLAAVVIAPLVGTPRRRLLVGGDHGALVGLEQSDVDLPWTKEVRRTVERGRSLVARPAGYLRSIEPVTGEACQRLGFVASVGEVLEG